MLRTVAIQGKWRAPSQKRPYFYYSFFGINNATAPHSNTLFHSPACLSEHSHAHRALEHTLFLCRRIIYCHRIDSYLVLGLDYSFLAAPSTPCSWISRDIFSHPSLRRSCICSGFIASRFSPSFLFLLFSPVGRLASGTSKARVLLAVSALPFCC